MRTAIIRWVLTVAWIWAAVYLPSVELQKAALFGLLLSLAAANELTAVVNRRRYERISGYQR